jgi:hypothetical protein
MPNHLRHLRHHNREGLIEIAFAPLPLGVAGGWGVATAKRKAKLLRAGFQPAGIFFW